MQAADLALPAAASPAACALPATIAKTIETETSHLFMVKPAEID
jgi:hypothetical protein